MKAALALMIELVKEATIAPEVSSVMIRFNMGDSIVVTAKNWSVDAATISARSEENIAFFDKDDIRCVEVILTKDAPVEWHKLPMLNLIQTLKEKNARRNRSQS